MMASKQPLFGGRLRADPEDRAAPGDREPANQSDPREAGAQRGVTHPGDPNIEVDLLDDDGGRQRGGWRSSTAIVAALAVFVGLLWYAYDWGMGQLQTVRLPVIVADTTPIKSRPESPGGIEVPDQDVAVLNDVVPDPAEPQAERLLPPPEAPQIAQTEAPQSAAPQVAPVTKVEELLGPPLQTAAGPPGKMPAAEAAPPPVSQSEAAPEPVLPEPKTETLLTPEPAAAPPGAPAVAPAVAPSVTPAAASREPAPLVAALPDARTSGFVVQLAALRAKDGARPAWTRLQKAYPALLGDRELTIQEADLGDRGIFYRVQAGFFADRAGARGLCNALKARGQDCLVVKR
ncbi:MAG: SPOR domain-containing protein [Kiloniellales bacterium]